MAARRGRWFGLLSSAVGAALHCALLFVFASPVLAQDGISRGSTFLQPHTGAVARSFVSKFQDSVSLFDFLTAAQRVSIASGARVNVTAALASAAAVKKPLVWPRGKYEVTSPVGFEADVIGAGAFSLPNGYGTDVLLSGTGQLTFDQAYVSVEGLYLASAVNGLTFVRLTAQGIRFHHFQLIGTGTSQVGIEIDTMQGAVAGAVAFLDVDHFKISGVATSMRITDTGYFNGNKLGTRSANWAGFTTALSVENTGGTQTNQIGGYFESAVNASSIVRLNNVGAIYSNNVHQVWSDGAGGAVINHLNNASAGTVGVNTWIGVPPGEWNETAFPVTVVQIFTDRVKGRFYRSVDQTGILDSTFTKVAFDASTFDYGAGFDAVNNRFVARRAMRVRVQARVNFSGNLAAGDTAFLSVYKNNAEVMRGSHVYASSSGRDLTVEDVLSLQTNDYVEIFVRGDQAAANLAHTVSGGSLSSYFSVEEL